MRRTTVVLLLSSLAATAFAADRDAGSVVEPPAMPRRAISPPTTAPAGEQIDIVDGDVRTILFVPAGYALPADGAIDLTVHFHTIAWFAIDEHLRRGLSGPLLVVQLGEGSSAYRRPFEDADRFERLLAQVGRTLAGRAAAEDDRAGRPTSREPRGYRIANVDLTSFSAGYGAVREIVRQERYVALIRRIILADSFYASWDPATPPGATSRPLAENVEPFAPFLKLAAAGKKTFVFTHSSVPTPYANTQATADWIAATVGGTFVDVPRNATPAASDAEFPLYRRLDVGGLHVWGYGGVDAQAHLTHVRHLADVWRALDAAEAAR